MSPGLDKVPPETAVPAACTGADAPAKVLADAPAKASQGKSAGFSPEQQKAIMHTDGPAMVLAGPGSGKTTVITNRALHLVRSKAAKAGEILIITFTVSAAAEMKDRYLKLTGQSSTEIGFGTFHSVFLNILKKYSDFSDFRLATPSESVAILKDILKALHPDSRYTTDYYHSLLERISRYKNTLPAYDSTEKAKEPPSFERLCTAYSKAMEARRLMDFDDMLLSCRRLLLEDPSVLRALQERYRFFMLDEFQDINTVQFDCIRLLAAGTRNLFVVGDDDQSIYGFRGSAPGIMLSFGTYYPEAARYELFTNYRSSGSILKAASRLIGRNRFRYRKKLSAANAPGPGIFLHVYEDAAAEAAGIAAAISALGPEYRSVGVLYRSHRAGSLAAAAWEKRPAVSAGEKRLSAAAWEKRPAVSAGEKRPAEGAGSIRESLPQPERSVRFLTFHASKGLEFDVVYILSANEGTVPAAASGKEGLEEERRLFYVAMTRARRELHISYTKYGYHQNCKPSRFLAEALPLRDRLLRKLLQR